MNPCIITRDSQGHEISYPLVAGRRLCIGRHRTNDLILRDEHCSRHHAEIREEQAEWTVVDLDSQNGTFLDDRRIAKAPLRDGQVLRIGSVRLRFRADSGNGPTATLPHGDAFREAVEVAASMLDDTDFQLDDFSALCGFMADVIRENDSRPVVLRALEAVKKQSGAELVGFLGLDEGGELFARMVLPSLSQVDLDLSRSLTQRVQSEQRPIWLWRDDQRTSSESLAAYRDAIVIPVPGQDGLLGALHAYQTGRTFKDRDFHFCEAVARHLAGCLRVIRMRRQLEAENTRLRAKGITDDQLIGHSPALEELRRTILRLAPQSVTVLIRGESGVGKELVAQAIHQQSQRRSAPFVVMNCAAIPANLMESQIFGHRKGAFTGADRDHEGYFQQADGGTLFLDEIGELSAECQAKLLRVLETKRFTPLGGKQEIAVDVRFLAATHRDLEKAIVEANFREDLYYRLKVVELRVPSLRAHPEDIPLIAAHFLQLFAQRGLGDKRLAAETLQAIHEHPWPGNVRQLRYALESAVILTEGDTIEPHHLRLQGQAFAQHLPTLNLDALERMAYALAIKASAGKNKEAIALLGVGRSTFYRKAEEFGIKLDHYESG